MKGVLSAEVAILMKDCEVPEDFKNWLCKVNFCPYDSFV